MTVYESIVKVVVGDPPEKRERDIRDGIAYACALLHDEYGLSAEQIAEALEGIADNVRWDYEDAEAEA